MKILVFSQGPIISTGTSGSGSWVEHNCLETIIRNNRYIQGIDSVDYFPVVWSSECTNVILQSFDSERVKPLLLSQPTKRNSNKFFKPNMKINQYFGCYSAASEARRRRYDLIVKIRHDQEYDLGKIIGGAKAIEGDGLYVLGIDRLQPETLLEFVLAARVDFFFELFQNCYLRSEVHREIGFDMFYKLAKINKERDLFYLERMKFFFLCNRSEKIYETISKNIYTFDLEILESLVWRGSRFVSEGGRYISRKKFLSTDGKFTTSINYNFFPWWRLIFLSGVLIKKLKFLIKSLLALWRQ